MDIQIVTLHQEVWIHPHGCVLSSRPDPDVPELIAMRVYSKQTQMLQPNRHDLPVGCLDLLVAHILHQTQLLRDDRCKQLFCQSRCRLQNTVALDLHPNANRRSAVVLNVKSRLHRNQSLHLYLDRVCIAVYDGATSTRQKLSAFVCTFHLQLVLYRLH